MLQRNRNTSIRFQIMMANGSTTTNGTLLRNFTQRFTMDNINHTPNGHRHTTGMDQRNHLVRVPIQRRTTRTSNNNLRFTRLRRQHTILHRRGTTLIRTTITHLMRILQRRRFTQPSQINQIKSGRIRFFHNNNSRPRTIISSRIRP